MESSNTARPVPAPQPAQQAGVVPLVVPPPATPTQAELDQMAEGTYDPTAPKPEAKAEHEKREREALEARHKREREQMERAMNPQAGSGYTTR